MFLFAFFFLFKKFFIIIIIIFPSSSSPLPLFCFWFFVFCFLTACVLFKCHDKILVVECYYIKIILLYESYIMVCKCYIRIKLSKRYSPSKFLMMENLNSFFHTWGKGAILVKIYHVCIILPKLLLSVAETY